MDMSTFLNQILFIKDTALSTVSLDGTPRNRIIDIMYLENNSLYFLTARGKNLYQELIRYPYASIAVCKNKQAYSLSGKVEQADKSYLKKLFDCNPFMYDLYKGKTANILEVFRFVSWSGEFFDLNCSPIYRKSFSYNSKEKTGYRINPSVCNSCGRCRSVCPSQCISVYDKIIVSAHCLSCGACLEACPFNAIIKE